MGSHTGQQPEHHEDALCVRRVPIFNHLDPEEMEEIFRLTTCMRYQQGEMIYLTGSTARKLFILHEGLLKQVRVTADGRQQIIRLIYPGDFIGELSLFGDVPLEGYLEMLRETEMCQLRGEDLRELIARYPTIASKILGEMSRRLNDAEERIEQLGALSVRQRLANILLKFAGEPEPDAGPVKFTLEISKGDMAALLGTTQETLSRRLREFRQQGWIALRGRRDITLRDPAALQKLAEAGEVQ